METKPAAAKSVLFDAKGFWTLAVFSTACAFISILLQPVCTGVIIGAQRWIALGTVVIRPEWLLCICGIVCAGYVLAQTYHNEEAEHVCSFIMLLTAFVATIVVFVYLASIMAV